MSSAVTPEPHVNAVAAVAGEGGAAAGAQGQPGPVGLLQAADLKQNIRHNGE